MGKSWFISKSKWQDYVHYHYIPLPPPYNSYSCRERCLNLVFQFFIPDLCLLTLRSKVLSTITQNTVKVLGVSNSVIVGWNRMFFSESHWEMVCNATKPLHCWGIITLIVSLICSIFSLKKRPFYSFPDVFCG